MQQIEEAIYVDSDGILCVNVVGQLKVHGQIYYGRFICEYL